MALSVCYQQRPSTLQTWIHSCQMKNLCLWSSPGCRSLKSMAKLCFPRSPQSVFPSLCIALKTADGYNQRMTTRLPLSRAMWGH